MPDQQTPKPGAETVTLTMPHRVACDLCEAIEGLLSEYDDWCEEESNPDQSEEPWHSDEPPLSNEEHDSLYSVYSDIAEQLSRIRDSNKSA